MYTIDIDFSVIATIFKSRQTDRHNPREASLCKQIPIAKLIVCVTNCQLDGSLVFLNV